MMGSRCKTNGSEDDAFTRGVRHRYHWRPGILKWMKRKFSKRMRRAARLQIGRETKEMTLS